MVTMLKCMFLFEFCTYLVLLKQNIDDVQMLELFVVLVYIFGATMRKAHLCSCQANLTKLKFFSTFCHLRGHAPNCVSFVHFALDVSVVWLRIMVFLSNWTKIFQKNYDDLFRQKPKLLIQWYEIWISSIKTWQMHENFECTINVLSNYELFLIHRIGNTRHSKFDSSYLKI